MKSKHYWLLVIGCWLLAQTIYAQLPTMGGRFPTGGSGNSGGSGGRAMIDDSTKQIYGPKTTRFFYEEDVLNNRKTYYNEDTSYFDLHQYNYIQRSGYQLTDLGNLGTAARSVFFRPIQNIGTQLGYEAFTPYMLAIDKVKYYNTKSPFTNMYLALGGNNQNILRFDHTQNISPKLNLGFNVQRMTTDKVYGTSGRSDAQRNLTQNWGFVLHGNYRSKDEKYVVLGQINALNQNNLEQGGIVPDSSGFAGGKAIDFFEITDPSARLTSASSWERRTQLHLYHQYVMAQGFQLYQTIDYRRDKNIFFDNDLADAKKYGVYPNFFGNVGTTNQDVRYRLFEHREGIKGRFRQFNYRAHFRQRFMGMVGSYNNSDSTYTEYKKTRIENFVGLWLNYFLKDSTQRVTAETEYLLGRDFKVKGEIVTNLFSAGYSSVFSSPTFIQQYYQSNHLRWENDFKQVGSHNIYGQINLRVKNWNFSPAVYYHLVSNYIYFNEKAAPTQYKDAFSVLRLGGMFVWNNKKWELKGETYYTANSNDKVLRMPKLFSNLKFAFDFAYPRKTKALLMQIGADAHYESAYYGDAYMPLTQQFYLQNTYKIQGNLLVDLFANVRIKRVRMFFKIANATDRLLNLNSFLMKGYFASPLYTGIGRSLGFGVVWPLFD